MAQLELPVADDAACLVRRIRLEPPAPGAEITGEYSPLEASLAWSVRREQRVLHRAGGSSRARSPTTRWRASWSGCAGDAAERRQHGTDGEARWGR